MTLKLELSPEEELLLNKKAADMGVDPVSYLRKLIGSLAPEDISLAESLAGYVGVIGGTPGPGDGRAWSEIEAACDPL